MFGFIKKILGTKQDRDLKQYQQVVFAINEHFERFQSLSNDELRGKTQAFRDRIADYLSDIDDEIQRVEQQAIETEDFNDKDALFKEVDALRKNRDKALEDILLDILPEAFAVVKETSRRFSTMTEIRTPATDHDRALAARPDKSYVRLEGDEAVWSNSWKAAGGDITWNMVHYDVQLFGGMVLHDGKIAEMATGEGKTLVATLPAYLNGVAGQGVHIVTVNDYLARRDQEWVGPIYEFLLLTVDCIDKHRPNSQERRQAYRADIIFGTNSEFGFDYLRDNMVISPEELVQRKHHYAIVDEVDSVLIDDARTPLIISGPVTRGADDQEYVDLNPTVKRLVDEQAKLASRFLADAKKLFAAGETGHDEGQAGLSLLRAHRALPKSRALIKFLSEPGMKVALQKTEDVYLQENAKRMPEVDRELLFHIDEKNRQVELTEKGVEYLSQFNNEESFFILPDIGSELVKIDQDNSLGDAEKAEAKELLSQDYGVKSRRIHAVHQLLKAYTLFERDDEYIVKDGEVKIVDEQTGRVMEGRRYSDGLHQAIEAKENVKVGEITQTYATVTLQNYFRMYHKLAGMTGTAETEAKELWDIYKLDVVVIPTNRNISRQDKDDLVFKTAREKYNAVIDEIIGLREAGRPVLVGTTSVEISEFLSRVLKQRGIDHNVLNAKQHQREAEIVAEAGLSGKVTIATNMAGRGTDIKLGPGVKDAGGLAIIGTERHESRRVDRQLRGRAGRQGDPGSSQFYVSLEDSLMRLFQSERIAGLMDRMGHQEGDMIQHSMVTKSIERAQKKVEENNFGIRKRLLEYDDVMNIQREAIYRKRRNALFGDRLAVDINNAFFAIASELVQVHRHRGDFDTFRMDSLRAIGYDPVGMDAQTFKSASEASVINTFFDHILEAYHRKRQQVGERLLPLIRNVREREGNRYRRIVVPFSDGAMGLNISADIDDAIRTEGKSIMTDVEKVATLALIDDAWKEHLRNIDDLKDSVQGASFEQKDPLVIYKMEAFNLFEGLIGHINANVTSFLLKGTLDIPTDDDMRRAQQRQQMDEAHRRAQANRLKANNSGQQMTESQAAAQRAAQAAGQAAQPVQKVAPMVREKVVGRNDPCPCGSGKKYKHCHGK
ncbi:MAG: preprotein translocase subunit SecA [Saprospiraceae bacterium]|nr:preprotein translocase subunit SecA [Saprospiraceae bacterium]